jgi:hypothetical protein
VPLQTVRDWLGHTNISQTSTYLESTLKSAHEAMRRFEESVGRVGRNEIATAAENGASETCGQMTGPDQNRADRTENSRSVVN